MIDAYRCKMKRQHQETSQKSDLSPGETSTRASKREMQSDDKLFLLSCTGLSNQVQVIQVISISSAAYTPSHLEVDSIQKRHPKQQW